MADTADTTRAIFALENVHFSYERDGQRHAVLNGVDLALMPGQHVGFYGPNGSGKTTLFRCITGLSRPQQGTVRFHGRTLQAEKDFYHLRCAVGFVLQHAEDQLFFPSVLEDVAFGPLNLGFSPEEARQRALETLRHIGLDGFENRLTHRLSGGEKKLVSLAAVLAEPTNGLDSEARQHITDVLRGLDTARITISHDWDFLAQVSSTYLTLDKGRLNADAPDFTHAHTHAHPLGNEPHAHMP